MFWHFLSCRKAISEKEGFSNQKCWLRNAWFQVARSPWHWWLYSKVFQWHQTMPLYIYFYSEWIRSKKTKQPGYYFLTVYFVPLHTSSRSWTFFNMYISNFLFLPVIDCHLIAAGHYYYYTAKVKNHVSLATMVAMALLLLNESADLYFLFLLFLFRAFSFRDKSRRPPFLSPCGWAREKEEVPVALVAPLYKAIESSSAHRHSKSTHRVVKFSIHRPTSNTF